jgi:hypothetical protein
MTEHEAMQDMFTKAYLGLEAQGFRRSMRIDHEGSFCAYRGENDRKCALGHYIPDAMYKPKMEKKNAEDLKKFGILPFTTKTSMTFVKDLQLCRDNNVENIPEILRDELWKFADKHNLTIPEKPQ